MCTILSYFSFDQDQEMCYQVKDAINNKNRSESHEFWVQIEYSLHSSASSEKRNEKNNKA
jgi:hypothetical protein